MYRDQETAVQGVPFLFSRAFLAAQGLLLAGRRAMAAVAGLSSRAFACVSGYFRPPPDPWLETALRRAFADFDRDLARTLHHKQAPR